jgi:hypothetical protein
MNYDLNPLDRGCDGVWRGVTGCKSHRLYWPTVKFDGGGYGGVPFLSWLLIAFNINKQSYPQLSLTDLSIFQIRRYIALPYIVTYYRWREMGDITLCDLWFEYVPHSTLLGWISRTYHFWFGLYWMKQVSIYRLSLSRLGWFGLTPSERFLQSGFVWCLPSVAWWFSDRIHPPSIFTLYASPVAVLRRRGPGCRGCLVIVKWWFLISAFREISFHLMGSSVDLVFQSHRISRYIQFKSSVYLYSLRFAGSSLTAAGGSGCRGRTIGCLFIV